MILHRLPRDFRWEANQLFLEAVKLRALGDRKAAMAKAQTALKIYPYFLRAHIFMGGQIREAGDVARAAYILAFASQSYPSDELNVQADSLNRMGRTLDEHGFQLRVHHHTPQLIDNAREWHRILLHTDPEYVDICVDVD